jgi:hypothetical protein
VTIINGVALGVVSPNYLHVPFLQLASENILTPRKNTHKFWGITMIVILFLISKVIRLPLPRPPHCSTLTSTNTWSLSTKCCQYACKRNELTTGSMLEGKPWSSKYVWRDSFLSLPVVMCNSQILFQNCPYSLTANSIKGVVLERLRVCQVDKITQPY